MLLYLMMTFPPDTLYCNLLGPFNDAPEKMEFYWKELMKDFYKRHMLKKSGQGADGKFNGKDIKSIFKDSNLEELSNMLRVEAEPFINYVKRQK